MCIVIYCSLKMGVNEKAYGCENNTNYTSLGANAARSKHLDPQKELRKRR